MAQNPFLGTVGISLFLLGNTFFFAHSIVTSDVRFGWGMFATYTRYHITYQKILTDGTSVPYKDVTDLVGDARVILPDVMRTTLFGHGVVLHWVHHYCTYTAQGSEENVREVVATIVFRVNLGASQEKVLRCART